MSWVEANAAAEHPTVHGTALTRENCPGQKVHGAHVKKLSWQYVTNSLRGFNIYLINKNVLHTFYGRWGYNGEHSRKRPFPIVYVLELTPLLSEFPRLPKAKKQCSNVFILLGGRRWERKLREDYTC